MSAQKAKLTPVTAVHIPPPTVPTVDTDFIYLNHEASPET